MIRLLGLLTGFSLLLGSPVPAAQMPSHGASPTPEFERIEQPLGVRLAVTAVGIGLIGLELWWFLGSQPQSRKAQAQQGVQELEIAVDGGYDPNRVVVQAGKPVRLTFFRKDPNSCLEQVLIPEFQIAKTLPLNQATTIEFTPKRPGDYPFTCGMNMFRGVIQVV